jgi:hypothetical protein
LTTRVVETFTTAGVTAFTIAAKFGPGMGTPSGRSVDAEAVEDP